MTARRFLILHGWENRRPKQHWQWWLTDQLRADGEQVLYPQLPDTDSPSLSAWNEALHAELAQLGDGERIVVAHSLATVLWLSAGASADRVLLVAPPSPSFLAQHEQVREWATPPLATAVADTRMVCADNDLVCPEGAVNVYADFGFDTDLIPGGGHLNPDAGYGPWPSMLAWCRDPATRITRR